MRSFEECNSTSFVRLAIAVNSLRNLDALALLLHWIPMNHFRETFGAAPSGSVNHIDKDILDQTAPNKNHGEESSLQFTPEQIQTIVDHLGLTSVSDAIAVCS
jgi:hypothetical protein